MHRVEPIALGLKLRREHGWVQAAGPATRLEVQVSHPPSGTN
jgi:hypothetical protein